MRKLLRTVLTGVSVAALGFTGTAVGTATPERSVDLPADVLSAMQRDLGLTADQAARRAVQQDEADRLDDVLKGRLGAAFGGAWFDAESGRLAVAVTDAARAGEVRAAGARAHVVRHSEADLEKIKGDLDALAGKQSDNANRDKPNRGRSDEVKGLVSWSVDPTANVVSVTALARGSEKAVAGLRKYGDAVRVEYTDVEPSTAAFLDGGDILYYGAFGGGYCSAGFNLRNVNNGLRYVLTAGHCGPAGTAVYGYTGAQIGTVQAAFFPTWDDAIVRVTNTAAWTQGPWVDVNPSQGGVVTVSGYSDSPVGTAICKSGVTTKLTCGVITAKRQTVTYSGGQTVYDLTRHNACVEPGDSGGSNYRNSGTRTAEGVTSGAQLYLVGGRYRCGAAVGLPNVSWYYPAAISLPYYQAAYGATLW
ncbi:S1 family peptidase [Saccharothrix sp.]|uniref:S1 family peptidase n=1 Tax=Saccharothrix sp. TaxID=1873460 RepID=UPI002811C43D|nr:S1 family peptidase [Saccharothrix sp.]